MPPHIMPPLQTLLLHRPLRRMPPLRKLPLQTLLPPLRTLKEPPPSYRSEQWCRIYPLDANQRTSTELIISTAAASFTGPVFRETTSFILCHNREGRVTRDEWRMTER